MFRSRLLLRPLSDSKSAFRYRSLLCREQGQRMVAVIVRRDHVGRRIDRDAIDADFIVEAVSYTHLTLPTIYSV